jgi:hypothetical protein
MVPDRRQGPPRALEIVRAQFAPVDLDADRERLVALEAKIARAVDLAIETGGIAAAKRKLEALEAERAALEARLAQGARAYRTSTSSSP